MPSSNRVAAIAALVLLASGAWAQDPAPDTPPAPSNRYDRVGYATVTPGNDRIAAAHATLPIGSIAEVTALDSGRTILVPVTAQATSGREIELSQGAAVQLGLTSTAMAPVRVRLASAAPTDLTALNAGRAAAPRSDTPPALLKPLRKMLAAQQAAATPVPEGHAKAPLPASRPPAAPKLAITPPPPRREAPTPRREAPIAKPTRGGFYVQVAAFSNAARAHSVANALGGQVLAAGGLYRVRLGPFTDAAFAKAERDGAARRGYGDARIVRED